jgi:hypothetical protein
LRERVAGMTQTDMGVPVAGDYWLYEWNVESMTSDRGFSKVVPQNIILTLDDVKSHLPAIWDWTRINCKRRLVNQPVMYSWLAPHQTLCWWCRCRWVNVKVVSFRFACIVKTPTDCLCTNLSALKNIS